LITPIEPFRIANRFPSAAIFGILAYEVLKIFEELLFGSSRVSNYGVLVELLLRILTVSAAGYNYFLTTKSLLLSSLNYIDFDIIQYLLHYNYLILLLVVLLVYI
jgi:hypothetical protein